MRNFEGKKLPLTDEQIEMLKLETKQKKMPFERAERGKDYYVIDITGEVLACTDYRFGTDDMLFDAANYCTDEKIMKQRALHEKLSRLLWKYSMEHCGGEGRWNCENKHYVIYKAVPNGGFEVASTISAKSTGAVYFEDWRTARRAINEIIEPFTIEHPDFYLVKISATYLQILIENDR